MSIPSGEPLFCSEGGCLSVRNRALGSLFGRKIPLMAGVRSGMGQWEVLPAGEGGDRVCMTKKAPGLSARGLFLLCFSGSGIRCPSCRPSWSLLQ